MNQYHKSADDLKSEMEQVAAAKNNPAQFDVLYDKYYRQVFVFVFRRSGDEQITADIVSQVFLKALINLPKFQFRGVPFSAWLFRIAMNEINMYFRKHNTERLVSLEKSDFSTIVDATLQEDNQEKEQKIMKALAQLPEESIQLIELRFFEKRSFNEVANILGISENNAKVKVYRVIDKLKQLILPKK